MKILVTGGNFNNKGAQAMLIIAMSELKKHFPKAELLFDSQEAGIDVSDYNFTHIDRDVLRNALAMKAGEYSAFKGFYEASKHAVWAVRDGKRKEVFAEYRYLKMLEDLEIVIDISGYNLSSKFGMRHNMLYLDIIRCAAKCNMKVYLMPQSFGPFNYGDNNEAMLECIKESLKQVRIIYAREKEGYDTLEKLGVGNLKLSCDLVLQNSEINWADIRKNELPQEGTTLSTDKNVLLVPNQKVFEHMKDDERLYKLYDRIMKKLISYNNDIYLVYHSNEDLKICRKLLELGNSDRVHIIEKELAFYEYEKVVGRCGYAVASRFHSIVLAYRQAVPCIALGWAVKYNDLLALCGQEKYVNSIADNNLEERILACIDEMEKSMADEKRLISEKVKSIREQYCFDEVFADLNGTK